jgi:hypothetical protein
MLYGTSATDMNNVVGLSEITGLSNATGYLLSNA